MPRGTLTVVWVPPLGGVINDFRQLSNDLKKIKVPIARSIEKVMIPSIQQNFNSGGRPSWQPLASYTVEKKGSEDILEETQDLKRAAGSLRSWRITDDTASLDEVPEYGIYHNTGYFNVPFNTRVPARVWALYQDDDVDNIGDVFAEWIQEVVESNMT